MAWPRVSVTGGEVSVRHLWGFWSRFPLASISSVEEIPATGLLAGIGAHGWRGHWTVNSTRRPAVRIHLDPPARGRVLGVPVRMRVLDLAPVDVEQLRRELAARG